MKKWDASDKTRLLVRAIEIATGGWSKLVWQAVSFFFFFFLRVDAWTYLVIIVRDMLRGKSYDSSGLGMLCSVRLFRVIVCTTFPRQEFSAKCRGSWFLFSKISPWTISRVRRKVCVCETSKQCRNIYCALYYYTALQLFFSTLAIFDHFRGISSRPDIFISSIFSRFVADSLMTLLGVIDAES